MTAAFEAFLGKLKMLGISITKEADLRERLAEVPHWQVAFHSLAANGKRIGIEFRSPKDTAEFPILSQVFDDFQFPERTKTAFFANLVQQ